MGASTRLAVGSKEVIVAGEAGLGHDGLLYWTITVALIDCEGPPATEMVIGIV
jgi:hypothetical protein